MVCFGAQVLEQSPLAAIRRRGVDVVGFARGCDYTWCNTTAGFAAAVDAAKRADVAIVFIGNGIVSVSISTRILG